MENESENLRHTIDTWGVPEHIAQQHKGKVLFPADKSMLEVLYERAELEEAFGIKDGPYTQQLREVQRLMAENLL